MRIAFLLLVAVTFWACTEPREIKKIATPEDPSDTKIKRNLEYLQAEPDTLNVDVKGKKDEAKPGETAGSAKTVKNDRKTNRAAPAASKDGSAERIK